MSHEKLLTFPDDAVTPLSIRAQALRFHDARSRALLHDIERVAQTDATVLIVGETGTGKELVARHLHHCSGRRGPFLAVNCGAFSDTLIDAELFGHEAGAYTGAAQARAGWFEAAHGGTLFLDEIGDLSPALQVKLLRVLQERQVVRLGSRRAVPFDVRLVAATNVDLRRAVEAQRFRADLYYRLSVATLTLPPLRERRGDILPLAQHFIALYAGKLGQPTVRLSDAAAAALHAYPWPGNIRELENIVHYAVIVCQDGVLQAEDFRFSTLSPGGPPVPDAHDGLTAVPAPAPLPDPYAPLAQCVQHLLHDRPAQLFQAIESLLVHQAFAHSRDNQVQTAKLLGVTRNTLRTLLKRHGLLPDAAPRALPRSAPTPARESATGPASASTH